MCQSIRCQELVGVSGRVRGYGGVGSLKEFVEEGPIGARLQVEYDALLAAIEEECEQRLVGIGIVIGVGTGSPVVASG